MPEISGFEVASRVKSIRADLPVILLTGYSNLATEETKNKNGLDGVVAKPYKLASLEEVIRDAIKRRHRSRL